MRINKLFKHSHDSDMFLPISPDSMGGGTGKCEADAAHMWSDRDTIIGRFEHTSECEYETVIIYAHHFHVESAMFCKAVNEVREQQANGSTYCL
jgi:hypothetical protein